MHGADAQDRHHKGRATTQTAAISLPEKVCFRLVVEKVALFSIMESSGGSVAAGTSVFILSSSRGALILLALHDIRQYRLRSSMNSILLNLPLI